MDIGYVTALGTSNNCNAACGGNNSETCGGGNANSVYNVSSLGALPTQPVTALPAINPAQPAAQTPPGDGLMLPINVAQLGKLDGRVVVWVTAVAFPCRASYRVLMSFSCNMHSLIASRIYIIRLCRLCYRYPTLLPVGACRMLCRHLGQTFD